MQTFKDKDTGQWLIDLTIGTVMRVKAESEGRFNLFEPSAKLGERELQHVLWDDMPTLWELLWFVVTPQAQTRGVTAEQFGQLMAADCLVAAQSAFFREWHDFFQSLQRPDKAVALEKLGQYNRKALELIQAKLQNPELAKIDQRVTAQMESALNKSFSKLLDSVESTPADTPGGNSTG